MPRDKSKTYKPRDPDPTLAARRKTAKAQREQPEKVFKDKPAPVEEATVDVGKTLAEQRTEQGKPPLEQEVERTVQDDDTLQFDGDTWQRKPNAGEAELKSGEIAETMLNETPAQQKKRLEKAERERQELEEAITESGEAKVGRTKYSPVYAAIEMQPVWRVFEEGGTPAGKELNPSDGGGFWSKNPNSDDPEKAANYLAARINEARERNGKLAKA